MSEVYNHPPIIERCYMKMCKKCGLHKTKEEFSVRNSAKDGLQSSCKSCDREYHQSEDGKASAKKYRQTKHGKAAASKTNKKYRSNIDNWAKRRANNALNRARKANVTIIEEDQDKIVELYKQTKLLSEKTGIQYEIDHTISLDNGGENSWSNLQVLEKTLNSKKKTNDEYLHGLDVTLIS